MRGVLPNKLSESVCNDVDTFDLIVAIHADFNTIAVKKMILLIKKHWKEGKLKKLTVKHLEKHILKLMAVRWGGIFSPPHLKKFPFQPFY